MKISRGRLHIKGGRLVTMNPQREVCHADLLVEDGFITALEEGLTTPAGARVLDRVLKRSGIL